MKTKEILQLALRDVYVNLTSKEYRLEALTFLQKVMRKFQVIIKCFLKSHYRISQNTTQLSLLYSGKNQDQLFIASSTSTENLAYLIEDSFWTQKGEGGGESPEKLVGVLDKKFWNWP